MREDRRQTGVAPGTFAADRAIAGRCRIGGVTASSCPAWPNAALPSAGWRYRRTASLPTAADVDAAARRLAGIALHTPLVTSPVLDAITGARVFLKAETLQRTGSFKFRGAYNKISALAPAERAGGVVAFSSGNHAQGVAAAARLLGIPAVIVMPSDAPRPKRERTAALGAEVVLYDRAREDRQAIAIDIAGSEMPRWCRPTTIRW